MCGPCFCFCKHSLAFFLSPLGITHYLAALSKLHGPETSTLSPATTVSDDCILSAEEMQMISFSVLQQNGECQS